MSFSVCVCLYEFISRNLNCNPFNIMGCLISREAREFENNIEMKLLDKKKEVNNSENDLYKTKIEYNNSEYRLFELKFKMQNIK